MMSGCRLFAVSHRAFNLLPAGEWAVMDIRKLNDAKAVECLWQPSQVDLLVFDGEAVRLIKRRTCRGR